MAASAYIKTAAEKEEYGIPLATPVEIMRASSLVDHYLRRPKGCVWTADSVGKPAYMAGATASLTYTSYDLIVPGDTVTVQVEEYVGQDDSLVSDILVLDRLKATSEACVVLNSAPGEITFRTVEKTHDGTTTPFTLERGLVVEEEKPLPGQRSVTRLSEWPIANILSAVGRYGYGRRSDQKVGYSNDVNLLSTMSAFGGPPTWNPFSIPASSLNPTTGDFWVPAGLLLAYYTDIKARYVGGWPENGLPPEIKIATATLVERIRDAPFGPTVRRFNTGKISIERFADSLIDPDTKTMLRPFMANWMI